MERIEIGDIFIEQDRREHGRMLRVLAIFSKLAYSPALDESYVACSSRGRATIISYDRLLDQARFIKQERMYGQLLLSGDEHESR